MASDEMEKNDSAVGLEEYIDQQIIERVEQVRSLQERIGGLDEQIDQIKDELRELLEQRGANWADDVGYARIISAGLRRSYDNQALDNLIINDPLRYGWLKDYRKETPVRGGVQVK